MGGAAVGSERSGGGLGAQPGGVRRWARSAARDAGHRSAALQAGVINKQAHGKHIDFPELIARQPVLSYQATLICNLLRGGRAGLRAAEIFTGGWTGRREARGGSDAPCRGRAGGAARRLSPPAGLRIFQLLEKKSTPRRRDRVFTQMLLIFFCNCLRYENIVSAARALHLLHLNSDA